MARAPTPKIDTQPLLAHLQAVSGLDDLRTASASYAEASDETLDAILEGAATFAAERLDALSQAGELSPPVWSNGSVRTNELHKQVWREFAEAGWIGLDLPTEYGGQGLPLVVAAAVQEIFDRHSAAFGMMTVSARSAARLIEAWGDETLAARWVPQLISGQWAATICVSESGAGSDAARIVTSARQDGTGRWRITGEKQWISYGGHDLTDRIGHCVLARTEAQKGLSLYLVPDRKDDGAANGVAVRSIEEKLGLHLSPTCVLGFDEAEAILLGEEGRGLPQMFTMIANMRISTGAMGLGIASGPADIALAYARERRQGGRGPLPSAIIEHADVQRQLLDMHTHVELSRGLIYQACVIADLARVTSEPSEQRRFDTLAQFLLPIVKTLGGDTAFNTADAAIQVLGAAGYTTDWPIEQALRDARVLSVFEGTTGIQALDLLHRRVWKDAAIGLHSMLDDADRLVSAETDSAVAQEARSVFASLRETADHMASLVGNPRDAEAGATALLELATQAALTWTALRLRNAQSNEPPTVRLRDLATYHFCGAGAKARMLQVRAIAGSDGLQAIRSLLPN